MENGTINTKNTNTKATRKKRLKLFNISHKVHRWLMLLIGAQFVIWSVTGAYMVFFDIDYIHGNSLVISHQNSIKPENLTYPTEKLFQQYPKAKNLSVGVLIDREVYRFNIAKQQYIVDAKTGETLSPLNQSRAMAIAKHNYSGNDNITHTALISSNPSFGLSARHLPVWEVEFDHFTSPTLYISANNGKVVSKRHQFWYLFDWMFRFHIMDYGDDEDTSNWLLFFIASFALLAALSGLMLTYFKVIKPIINSRNKRGNKRQKNQRYNQLDKQRENQLPNGDNR